MPGEPGVVARPIRQVPGREAGPGLRQVFALQHVEVGPLRRLDLVPHEGEAAGAQIRLVRERDRGGQGLQRRQQGTGLRRLIHLGPDLVDHFPDDVPRLGEARRDPAPGVGDLRLVIGGQALEALDPRLGVGPVVDGGGARSVVGDVEGEVVAGEGFALLVEGEPLQLVARQPVQEGPVQRILGIERRPLQRLQPVLESFQVALAGCNDDGRIVRP